MPIGSIGRDPGNVHVSNVLLTELISHLCLSQEEEIRTVFENALLRIDIQISQSVIEMRGIVSSAFSLVEELNAFEVSRLPCMIELCARALPLVELEATQLSSASTSISNAMAGQLIEGVILMFLSALKNQSGEHLIENVLHLMKRILLCCNGIHVKFLCSLLDSILSGRRGIEYTVPVAKTLDSIPDLGTIQSALCKPQFLSILIVAGMTNNSHGTNDKSFFDSLFSIIESLSQWATNEVGVSPNDSLWKCAIQPLKLFYCLAIESSYAPRNLNAFASKLEVCCSQDVIILYNTYFQG